MEARGGAEVRRLHIIYFLKREGYDEHPHLVKVHHLSNTSVKLRDIKDWLGEVRGRNMPESFAWSFKRKYKTGYVWQDLLDDDDVTPISDNEYVLQGSQIPCNTNTPDPSPISLSSDDPITKLESESESNSLLNKLPEKIDKKGMTTARRAPPDKAHLPSSLRTLINCGGVDTKESAVAAARGKPNGSPFHPRDNVGPTGPCYDWTITEKSRGTRPQWSRFESRDPAKDSMKMTNSTYSSFVRLIRPNCSQCGKMFKPEKLHRHMKSCKGMNKSFDKANMNRAVYFPSSDENKSQMGNRAEKSCNFSFS